MLNQRIASQNAAFLGVKNCVKLRDRSSLCYKTMINYDLDIKNILVVSPQVRYIAVFDITNPRFNEQIWPVPSDFLKSRIHCSVFERRRTHSYRVDPAGYPLGKDLDCLAHFTSILCIQPRDNEGSCGKEIR